MARRKSQLVCQHLENISRRMLEEYQEIIRDFVRGRNGVYALYRRGKLYYVGLASSLLGRLRLHLRDRHGDTWDRFSVYLTIGPDYMKEIESLILRVAEPPGNKVKGKFIRSENLLGKVKAEYRRRRVAEEEDLFGAPRWRRKAAGRTRLRPFSKEGRKPILAEHAEQVRFLIAPARVSCSKLAFGATAESILAASSTRPRPWPPQQLAADRHATGGPFGSTSTPLATGCCSTSFGSDGLAPKASRNMTARRTAAGDNPLVTRRSRGATNSRASAYGDEAVHALGVPRRGTGR